MARDLEGFVAFITGATSGIGLAVAEAFARAGAVAGVNSFDGAAVGETVAKIAAEGGRAFAAPADVTDPAALEGAVEALVAAHGRLDALVISAGIQTYGTVLDTTEALWDRTFEVNVKGAFLAARACAGHLRRSGRGAVVVVSSVQGSATQQNVLAYSSSKGALNAFTRALAVDEAPHGVRVNSVSPGSVDTPMLRASAARFAGGAEGADRLVARWGASHPIGRVGTPEEIAEAVLFLASPRAGFVTGADLRVDGGLLAAIAAALPDERGEADEWGEAAGTAGTAAPDPQLAKASTPSRARSDRFIASPPP